ncbi:hypothetical protein SK128_000632 [Halocaridina rubra]|uniref:Uncharacterized protein n=1 Tax=Halocaridina rubra TaxID=373956 RepID=A0AAN8X5Z4_HALRR
MKSITSGKVQVSTPGAPVSLTETSLDRKSITLEWEKPEDVNGILLGYQLAWGSNTRNLTANETSAVISNLKPKTTFNISLQAITTAGLGDVTWIEVSTERRNPTIIVLSVFIPLVILVTLAIILLYRQRLFSRKPQKTTKQSISETELSEKEEEWDDQRAVPPGPIKKKDLQQYILSLEADSQAGLEKEFAYLRDNSPKYSTNTATEYYNKPKNRYANILPYDHARVSLSKVPEIEGSDYINASYIKEYHSKNTFVACQGPMHNTVEDHWRMIWELKVTIIVMLTNLIEKGRDKCYKYWPEIWETYASYGDIQIRNHNEVEQPLYTIRYLEMKKVGNGVIYNYTSPSIADRNSCLAPTMEVSCTPHQDGSNN